MQNQLAILMAAPFSMFGGDSVTDTYRGGYQTLGDVVNVTNDGVDLNAPWAEFQATMAIYKRIAWAFSSASYLPGDQYHRNCPAGWEASFEMVSSLASRRLRELSWITTSLATISTIMTLPAVTPGCSSRDADARQVEAVHQEILRADSRLLFKKIMEAIFDNRNRVADIRNQNYNVIRFITVMALFRLPIRATAFTGSHSHYLTSGNSKIDSGDLEDAYEHIAEHGYGIENGTQFVWLGNKAEIQKFVSSA